MNRVHRLRSSRDFRRVLTEGRRAPAGAVVVVVRRGDARLPARVGVSANRNVRGAVQRNRVKRLLREAARTVLPSIPGGTDVVLIAGPAATGRDIQEIRSAVLEGLKKAGVAC